MAEQSSSLEQLSIRSLGVIESSELEFTPGLNVLTGETGAGKTMVLTALGLILGSKTDADFVRTGSERLSVSAHFSIPKSLTPEIEELGAELEGDELIVSRSVTAQGKSRITLGGAQVTATQANIIGEQLVEVHAQSSTARLLKLAVQRSLLDSYGELERTLGHYKTQLDMYRDLEERISSLRNSLLQRDKEISLLKAFVEDFSQVSPKENEINEIENEISRLGSVESINSELTAALNFLSDEEQSALNLLNSARKSIESLRGKDAALDSISDKFLDSLYEVQEVSGEIARYLSALEADPQRFESLQARKAAINLLLKKYGKGSDKQEAYDRLLEEGSSATTRIADLSGGDDRLKEMEVELSRVFAELKRAGEKLSTERKKVSGSLAKEITTELAALSMPQSQIVVEIESADSASAKNYSDTGLDEVKFLFTSHTGANPLPLSKAASGGELSRVMLAIEIVLSAKSTIGTYIFDEVDAGVGGKAAIEVGRRLARLAKKSQVIVVTHLAQVAVWADNHLVVSKDESGSYSQSSIRKVDKDERKVEIARLLSGQEQSSTAQEHAAELLELVRNS